MTDNILKNPIDEYFTDRDNRGSISKEIFNADQNIDLKTEISDQEIVLINNLMWNDSLLQKRGLSPLYQKFVEQYLRLKVSRNRKGREEFVKSITGNNDMDNVINTMSQFKNITDTKK